MLSSQSAGRRHPTPEHELWTAYQRDRRRIVNSRAFRRLQYKTQVFVNHEGDYYRTRLTHTIEAAQIARTVAQALRLNEDLTEAITLAHDIGHPPFGHAGERALAALMCEHGGFEHNAQALRLVDLLERRYSAHRGLNLSFEVREGLWKRRDSEACRTFGYDAEFDASRGPLLEAQVSDWSDGIAYDHHDLDDALKAGILRLGDLRSLSFWDEAWEAVERAEARAGADADTAERVRRQELIRHLVGAQVRDLVDTTRQRLAEHGIQGLADVRAAREPLVGLSEKALRRKRELQRFLDERVYQHYRVKRQVLKGRRFLSDLFAEFCRHPNLLPEEYQEWVEREGLERGVCDYIAGMTDRYAQREHRKLFAVFEPM
ncbi:MAG: deoxyguanosinetriphosphate triphosphohydrolase [Planctomycetota bacterium]|nr:MAG: deoxyguanosinetriphosphate triphosphohydrolase [Planctomycetota bacterium]